MFSPAEREGGEKRGKEGKRGEKRGKEDKRWKRGGISHHFFAALCLELPPCLDRILRENHFCFLN
jgi:hypothetical protein